LPTSCTASINKIAAIAVYYHVILIITDISEIWTVVVTRERL